MATLIDVRCPLPSKGRPDNSCNKLCVRVEPGSAGKAYCPRHEQEFDFQVDNYQSFSMLEPRLGPSTVTLTPKSL